MKLKSKLNNLKHCSKISLHVHGFVDDSSLEVVENVVVVFVLLGLLHQSHELLLQDFPADLDALHAQLVLGPLLQLDVDRRVESSCKMRKK